MSKKTIFLISLGVILILSVFFATSNSLAGFYSPQNIINKYDNKFEDMINLPNGVYNIDLKLSKDQLQQGTEIKFKRLLPFSEAIQITGGKSDDYQFIASDTLVWVVQGYIPSIDHPRFGKMENVLVTSYFDAYTGEIIGSVYN